MMQSVFIQLSSETSRERYLVTKMELSARRISIDDYPEHLNPFYEDDNHKNIRFWAVTKKKLRSNSFSFSGFDEKVKGLRFSFRNKSRKTNTDTDSSDKKENEIPTKDEFLKSCNSGRYVYKGSETPVLNQKTYTTDQSERRRFGFSTLSRLPTTSTPKKTAPFRPNTLNGTENIKYNPFEKTCDLSPILNRNVNEDRMSLTRRKKRQAPLPPISAFQSKPTVSPIHLEDSDSAINMTDEIFNIELQITETDLEITQDSGIVTDKCQITHNSSVLCKNEKYPFDNIDKSDENDEKINVIKTENDFKQINVPKSTDCEKDEKNNIGERKEDHDGYLENEGKQSENTEQIKEVVNISKTEKYDKNNINDRLEININEFIDKNIENDDCVIDEINVTNSEKNYIDIDNNCIADENLQINEEINNQVTETDKDHITEIKVDQNLEIITSIAIEKKECINESNDRNNNENIEKIEQNKQFSIEPHQDIVFIDGSSEENIQNPNIQIKIDLVEQNCCNNKVSNMKKIFEKRNNDVFVFNNDSKNKKSATKTEKRSSGSDYSDIDANSPNPIPKPRRSRIMFTSK